MQTFGVYIPGLCWLRDNKHKQHIISNYLSTLRVYTLFTVWIFWIWRWHYSAETCHSLVSFTGMCMLCHCVHGRQKTSQAGTGETMSTIVGFEVSQGWLWRVLLFNNGEVKIIFVWLIPKNTLKSSSYKQDVLWHMGQTSEVCSTGQSEQEMSNKLLVDSTQLLS
jgi:hypothetical protein